MSYDIRQAARQVFPRESLGNVEPADFAQFVAGYVECVAWADAPEGSRARFARSSYVRAIEDCAAFCRMAGPVLQRAADSGADWEQLGADFWLDRCGHGAGSQDRAWADVELETIARPGEDRDGKFYGVGDTVGEALSRYAYGTYSHISRFAYASVYAYRGWLYFA